MIEIATYLVMILSIIGTVANSLKKRWCFYLWGCTNLFWCIHNFCLGEPAQGVLYFFNLCMALVGLSEWKKGE